MSLNILGGLDDNERLAHRDKTRIHGEYVVAALSRNLRGLMRASRDFGVRKMQNGRIGLLGMDTVIYVRKICRRTATGLGHYAKLVAARVNLERIDGAVLNGLVTNCDMHGHAHDAVALAELRRHIRPRLNHDYVLAHYYHDPSRHWLFNTWHAPPHCCTTAAERQRDAAPCTQQRTASPWKTPCLFRILHGLQQCVTYSANGSYTR